MAEKNVLDRALTSPDTVVRHAAIRRMSIENEIVQLDAFLAFYAGSQVEPEVSDSPKLPIALGDAKPKARPNAVRAPTEPKTPRVSKGHRLADTVIDVLTEHRKPMQLQHLFDTLRANHPDICPQKVDSLRPRLHEQRDRITMIKGQGYWPAGVEISAQNA